MEKSIRVSGKDTAATTFSRLIKEYNIIIVLLAIMAIFSLLNDKFLSYKNLITVVRQVSMMAIAGMGMTCCLLTGMINLSLGALVSFECVFVAKMISEMGMSTPLACVSGMLICTLVGLFTGWIIEQFHIPALIGTLAIQTIFNGLAFLICDGIPIYDVPDSIKFLGQGYWGPFPVPVVVMLVVVLIFAFVFNKTYFGRWLFATGSNEEAARLSGIQTKLMRYLAFSIAGLTSGIAGLLMLGRVGSGQPAAGANIETNVLSAVVIGGVRLSGGEGKVSKALAGVLIIGVINNGLTILSVSEYVQMITRGMLFLFAVCFDSFQTANQAKRGKKV